MLKVRDENIGLLIVTSNIIGLGLGLLLSSLIIAIMSIIVGSAGLIWTIAKINEDQ